MLAYGGPGDWPDDGCPKLEFAWEYAQTQEGGRVEYALLYTGRGRLCLDRIGRDLHWLGRHALALAYGDEDVLAGGEASHPRFAPAWSPDTFLHHPYLGAVLAVDMALARSLEGEPALLWKEALEAGGGTLPPPGLCGGQGGLWTAGFGLGCPGRGLWPQTCHSPCGQSLV